MLQYEHYIERCSLPVLFIRYNGLLTMRQSWPPVALTDVSTSGISVKSGRSSQQKMLRMAHRSSCLSMVATQPRSPTFPGTPMNRGSSAQYLRTISCKSGRWRRISTMMRSQITPLHQSWRLRDHNPALYESVQAQPHLHSLSSRPSPACPFLSGLSEVQNFGWSLSQLRLQSC